MTIGTHVGCLHHRQNLARVDEDILRLRRKIRQNTIADEFLHTQLQAMRARQRRVLQAFQREKERELNHVGII